MSCEHDNYDAPNAVLSGRIVYEDEPVGVRTNGAQLELWQEGYDLYKKIPVHISHDGTFSASLFSGQYKLVRLQGAPWLDQSSDTITVDVSGRTEVDVPITPYFTIIDESFVNEKNEIIAKFKINKIVEEAKIHSVNLYLGKAILTDHNKNEMSVSLDLDTYIIGEETMIKAALPKSLENNEYIFARIGVRSDHSNEYLYTQVKKINLK